MLTISRSIFFFVVAFSFVVISLLTYTEVLSKQSKLTLHPSAYSFKSKKFKNTKFSKFVGKELLNSYARQTSEELLQRPFNSSDITAVNLTNLPAIGRGHRSGLKIMLMARMRTGSTLLGEIFNQNPNLFYLFEPLHATDNLVQMRLMELGNMKVAMANLLRKLAICNAPSEYMFDVYNWGISKGKSRTLRGMCQARTKCSNINPGMFSSRCAERKGHIAMKMIRADLETIQPLITNDHLDVKILHLVRDPRGTANSRRSFYCKRRKHLPGPCTLDVLGLLQKNEQKYKYNTVHKFCSWMRQTVTTALSRPKWLRGRYKLIRYEDLAAEPLRFAKEIYKFLGLALHPDVAAWVEANTQANTKKSKKPFSTNKNSSEAAIHWRDSLTFREAEDVQAMCGDVMELLGYLPIKSEDDLTNFSVPVTSPHNIGADISFT